MQTVPVKTLFRSRSPSDVRVFSKSLLTGWIAANRFAPVDYQIAIDRQSLFIIGMICVSPGSGPRLGFLFAIRILYRRPRPLIRTTVYTLPSCPIGCPSRAVSTAGRSFRSGRSSAISSLHSKTVFNSLRSLAQHSRDQCGLRTHATARILWDTRSPTCGPWGR